MRKMGSPIVPDKHPLPAACALPGTGTRCPARYHGPPTHLRHNCRLRRRWHVLGIVGPQSFGRRPDTTGRVPARCICAHVHVKKGGTRYCGLCTSSDHTPRGACRKLCVVGSCVLSRTLTRQQNCNARCHHGMLRRVRLADFATRRRQIAAKHQRSAAAADEARLPHARVHAHIH